MSELPAEVDSIVRTRFEVKDRFILPEGGMEYKVGYTPESKSKFAELSAELDSRGYTAWLSGRGDDYTLQLLRKQPPKPSPSRWPVIMALLTVGMVMIFGLFELQVFDVFAPSIPYYVVFVSYVACMVAVLAAHEFGRRYSSEKRGAPTGVPYFIPGLPAITAFLPSLGVISRHKAPLMNRDVAFDQALAGPLAVFSVSLLLYIVSEFASVQSAVPLLGGVLQKAQFQVQVFNPSVIQIVIDSLFSLVIPSPSGGYIRLSPIADAASVGFFLTFLGLIPVAFFDGGQAASAVLRPAALRAASYICGAGLMVLDFPNYWVLGLGIFTLSLLASGRQTEVQLYDEVSAASPSRRTIFLLVLLLALCCIPIPQNLASIPLG